MNKQAKIKAKTIHALLEEYYPETPIPLDHEDPYTLLIAVLLSAQCKDERVNQITPSLFRLAKTPQAMVKLTPKTIEDVIRPCGLAPRKSMAIWKLSQILLDEHDGQVPQSFEDLEALPGVGHKTASVVMAQAFGHPAFPVDTHIHRLARRWGLSSGKNVVTTENDLKELFPKKYWNKVHLQIIFFGREFCPARGHVVDACPICSWAMSDEERKVEMAKTTKKSKASKSTKASKKPKPSTKTTSKNVSSSKPSTSKNVSSSKSSTKVSKSLKANAKKSVPSNSSNEGKTTSASSTKSTKKKNASKVSSTGTKSTASSTATKATQSFASKNRTEMPTLSTSKRSKTATGKTKVSAKKTMISRTASSKVANKAEKEGRPAKTRATQKVVAIQKVDEMKRSVSQDGEKTATRKSAWTRKSASVAVDAKPISVAVCAVFWKKRLLLIRRAGGAYQNLWGLPGGKIEVQESLSQAAVREMKEEASLATTFVEHRGVVSELLVEEGVVRSHFLLHICLLRAETDAIISSPEGELGWFTMSAMRRMKSKMIPSDLPILEAMIQASETHYIECVLEKVGDIYQLKQFETFSGQ